MSKRLDNAFRRAEALAVEALIEQIKSNPKLSLPQCWLLERAHDYTNAKSAAVQVNVSTVNGIPDEVLKRAKVFVHRDEPKRLNQ